MIFFILSANCFDYRDCSLACGLLCFRVKVCGILWDWAPFIFNVLWMGFVHLMIVFVAVTVVSLLTYILIPLEFGTNCHA